MSIKNKINLSEKTNNIPEHSFNYLCYQKEIEKIANISSRMSVAAANAIVVTCNQAPITYPHPQNPVDAYEVVSEIKNDVIKFNKLDRYANLFANFNAHFDTFIEARDMLIQTSDVTFEREKDLINILSENEKINKINLEGTSDKETIYPYKDKYILISGEDKYASVEILNKEELESYIKHILKPENEKEILEFINEREKSKTEIEK